MKLRVYQEEGRPVIELDGRRLQHVKELVLQVSRNEPTVASFAVEVDPDVEVDIGNMALLHDLEELT